MRIRLFSVSIVITISMILLVPAQKAEQKHGSFFLDQKTHIGGRGLGGGHHIGIFPRGEVPEAVLTAYFLDRMLFSGEATRVSEERHGLYRYGFNPYYADFYSTWWQRPKNYSSEQFVSEWIDRDPVSPPRGSGLEDSILLKEGMDQADVMGALGAPVQRIQLGGREVWKYSSFSLFFEAGRLVELR